MDARGKKSQKPIAMDVFSKWTRSDLDEYLILLRSYSNEEKSKENLYRFLDKVSELEFADKKYSRSSLNTSRNLILFPPPTQENEDGLKSNKLKESDIKSFKKT